MFSKYFLIIFASVGVGLNKAVWFIVLDSIELFCCAALDTCLEAKKLVVSTVYCLLRSSIED